MHAIICRTTEVSISVFGFFCQNGMKETERGKEQRKREGWEDWKRRGIDREGVKGIKSGGEAETSGPRRNFTDAEGEEKLPDHRKREEEEEGVAADTFKPVTFAATSLFVSQPSTSEQPGPLTTPAKDSRRFLSSHKHPANASPFTDTGRTKLAQLCTKKARNFLRGHASTLRLKVERDLRRFLSGPRQKFSDSSAAESGAPALVTHETTYFSFFFNGAQTNAFN